MHHPLERQPSQRADALDNLGSWNLGLAVLPVDEVDRDLGESQALAMQVVDAFHEERVAIIKDVDRLQGAQCLRIEGPHGRRVFAKSGGDNRACENISRRRYKQAKARVVTRPTLEPRADDEIVSFQGD